MNSKANGKQTARYIPLLTRTVSLCLMFCMALLIGLILWPEGEWGQLKVLMGIIGLLSLSALLAHFRLHQYVLKQGAQHNQYVEALQTIGAHSPKGIAMTDLKGAVYFQNQRFEQLILNRPEVWNQNELSRFFPEIDQNINLLQEIQQGRVLKGHYFSKDQNGKRKEFAIQLSGIQNQSRLAEGMAIWVSEKSDAQESKQMLDQIMQSNQNGIMTLQAIRKNTGLLVDFECIMINQAARQMLDSGRSHWDQIRLLESFPEFKENGLFQLYKNVVEEDQQLNIEHFLDDPISGKRTWMNTRAAKLGDGLSVSFQDISDRKWAEESLLKAKYEAETAAKAKADFLATMSHEIRTPMNAVIGMTALLLRSELTADQQEYVETIRISGENLLTVINDILDFSKIDSGKLELEKQPFSLLNCVEDVYDLLSTKANEKGLELIYQIDQTVPNGIISDPTRLRQVLVNLVGNAIKFTKTGEIEIQVRLLESDESGNLIGFAVRDTGIGIPEDKIPHLFRSFSQVDSSTTRKYGGTGLGLAICKKLVDLMGGKIWIESEYGSGSTFHFTIRVGTDPKAANRLQWEGPGRILWVDANALLIESQRAYLSRWDINVAGCTLAQDALELLGKENFDLVIISHRMPDMAGDALAATIRTSYPSINSPILLLSSASEKPIISDPPSFNQVLRKPLKRAYFHKAYHQLLGSENFIEKTDHSAKDVSFEDEEPFRTNLNILIVEDNLINQKVASRILKQFGFTADVAGNGLEALHALDIKSYDLLFMDLQMPEMDGLEATTEIHKRFADDPTLRPRIIAMTANALQGDRERCLKAGMDDYISKPVQISEVEKKLTHWFPIGQENKNPIQSN